MTLSQWLKNGIPASGSPLVPTAGQALVGNGAGFVMTPVITGAGNAAKAWVKFHISNPNVGGHAVVIDASFNIASVVLNNTGDFTITFSTAFADANYALVIGGRMQAGNSFWGMEQHDAPLRTTTQVRIYTLQAALQAPRDPDVCSVVVFR